MANIDQAFTPSSGFILIKVENQETDIDIAGNEGSTSIGKVITVGDSKRHESGDLVPSGVFIGDTVVFRSHGVDKIYLNNNEYKIVPFEYIRGVLNEKD